MERNMKKPLKRHRFPASLVTGTFDRMCQIQGMRRYPNRQMVIDEAINLMYEEIVNDAEAKK